MHEVVIDGLERHLNGGAEPAFYAHLEVCPDCRAGVAQMEDLSAMFREFRVAPEAAPEPRLGFYNRVASRIVADQRREAWGLLAPGAVFFRRIAFASLLLLAGLGSYLVSRETAYVADPADARDAVAIMAGHDTAGAHAASDDRSSLMVTLANYRE